MKNRVIATLMLACSATLPIWGCGTPKGDSGGRVTMHTTTKAEQRSPGMVGADMASASDKVAREVVHDMQRVVNEEFVDPNVRVMVVFGDVINRTRTMPRGDVEMIVTRLKNKLQKSDIWRYNVKFAASSMQMDRLRDREYGAGDEDPFGDEEPQGTERAANQHFYYLNGQLNGAVRGSTEIYLLTITLLRDSDGAEVFTGDYEVKYDKD